MPIDTRSLEARFATAKILIVDDEHYMRKVVRTLLMSIGVRNIFEAADGPAGLEMIRNTMPDMVILDWEMPGLDGAGFVRLVRSPQTFPLPDIPIIMLTGHGERSRVIEAIEIGVNEFLLTTNDEWRPSNKEQVCPVAKEVPVFLGDSNLVTNNSDRVFIESCLKFKRCSAT